MRTINVANGAVSVSEIALGCFRIASLENFAIDQLVKASLDQGITFFDHADIYGAGKSESVFASSIQRLGIPRHQIMLQSKCGIRIEEGMYDFSKEHILSAVEGSLKRLNTDFLDVLLLHRPDALAEPDEIAQAFSLLLHSGKVRFFGVSNHNPTLIELLQSAMPMKLLFNQLQLSAAFAPMIASSLHMNNCDDEAVVRDGGVLDYCRLHSMTIQAWSPFQYGFMDGVFLGSSRYPQLNEVIDSIAREHQVSSSAVAVAWISRHPARIQTILGTTQAHRVKESCQSQNFQLSRQEWYRIYRAAGYSLL